MNYYCWPNYFLINIFPPHHAFFCTLLHSPLANRLLATSLLNQNHIPIDLIMTTLFGTMIHLIRLLNMLIYSITFLMVIGTYCQTADDLMWNYLNYVSSNYFICHSGDLTEKSCITNMYEYNGRTDSITLAYFLISEPDDRLYTQLYLTWLDHILNDISNNFNSCSSTQCSDGEYAAFRNFNHFIMQVTGSFSTEQLKQYVKDIIVQLPARTAFVILNCSPSFPYYNPELILDARRSAGFETNNVMIHLNHEQPGSDPSDPTVHSNHCYGDFTRLRELYSQFNLVIRNYYYEPFGSTALYLPLGPSFFHLVTALEHDPEYVLLHSSQRSVQCYFMGRSSYPQSGAHQVERTEIVDLYARNKFPCQYEYFPIDGVNYLQYQKEMRLAVFAPAPAGNSYETFRLYEALELGCIPIIVGPGNEKSNYLLSKDWMDYPGPVLGSWSELAQFMNGYFPTDPDEALSWQQMQELDNLQERVIAWYLSFKEKKRFQLQAEITRVLTSQTQR